MTKAWREMWGEKKAQSHRFSDWESVYLTSPRYAKTFELRGNDRKEERQRQFIQMLER